AAGDSGPESNRGLGVDAAVAAGATATADALRQDAIGIEARRADGARAVNAARPAIARRAARATNRNPGGIGRGERSAGTRGGGAAVAAAGTDGLRLDAIRPLPGPW